MSIWVIFELQVCRMYHFSRSTRTKSSLHNPGTIYYQISTFDYLENYLLCIKIEGVSFFHFTGLCQMYRFSRKGLHCVKSVIFSRNFFVIDIEVSTS